MRTQFPLAIAMAFTCLAGAAKAQDGPGCPYFLTAPDDDLLLVVKEQDVQSDALHSGEEHVIAVPGTVRTAGDVPGVPGAEYDQDLNYLGREFTLRAPQGLFFDGATDGQFFYSIDFSTGDVYRFKKNWKAGEVVWSANGPGTWGGITYDAGDDTFWISRWNSNRVEHYSRDGAFLERFTVGHDKITCLGLHYETGLLWMGDEDQPGVFQGYDRDGNFVDSIDYGFAHNTIGGDFDLGETAKVRSFTVRDGTHISGGLGAVKIADNDRMKIDAEELPNGSQRMEIEFRFRTTVQNAERMDLVVEHRTNVSGGETRLFLKNWNTGEFDEVLESDMGTTERYDIAQNFQPQKYVRDDGLIIARIRHTHADPPPDTTVRSQIDLVQVNVRS